MHVERKALKIICLACANYATPTAHHAYILFLIEKACVSLDVEPMSKRNSEKFIFLMPVFISNLNDGNAFSLCKFCSFLAKI